MTTSMTDSRCSLVRASALPRIAECPGSARIPVDAVVVESVSDAARLGRVVHDLLAREGTVNDAEMRAVCEMHGVEYRPEVRILYYTGRKIKAALPFLFGPESVAETALSFDLAPDLVLTGHPDRMFYDANTHTLYVLDWKTGRHDSNFAQQMAAYGWLGLQRYPEAERVVVMVAWLRDATYETKPDIGTEDAGDEPDNLAYSRVELDAWAERAADRILQWDGRTYTTGDHCVFCPRLLDCPGRSKQLAVLAHEIGEVELDTTNLTPEKWQSLAPVLATAHQNAKMIARAVDTFLGLLKDNVRNLGPVPTDNGKELRIVMGKRDKINTLLAWPVLTAELPDDVLAGCVSVSKTAVLDAVAERVGRGGKKEAKERVMASLQEAGAVIQDTFEMLKEVRKED